MKKCLSKIIPAFIILWVFLYAPVGVVTGLSADQNNVSGAKNETANVGYLENILFEKVSGRERVSLVVSQQPLIAPPSIQPDNSLLIRMENMFAPDNLRETLGGGQLLNVTGVRAQQQTAAGKQWVNLRINLKENVPYSIRQEGKIVIIDFNISSIEAKLISASSKSGVNKRQSASKPREVLTGGTNEENETVKPARRETINRYTDRMISLDFQDADIRSVLRLMSEYGNVSIISGDDVKGNVTLTMKNVPWSQAFDSILDVQGLTKKQMGDVITVMTNERKKKEESDKAAAERDTILAETTRKAREQQLLVDKGKLRQIMIEAKIVEATEDFVRNLGVQWGFGNTQSIGSYGLGTAAGTNPLYNTNAQSMAYPSEITGAATATMAAVNFPSSIIGPTLGLVFGNARGFIEAQLSALESTTQGKVISSPKVVTMDNVKAFIKQGDEVPYVTPGALGAAPTVSFKEAVLRLEVKPKITDEGKISMEIKATNDTPDYAQGEKLQGNPPIHKNEVESQIVVSDGDTVVIGGVSRNTDEKSISGVPWFYKIPVLGWLFKTENTKRSKRQLLIFITPRILPGSGYVEDVCAAMKLDDLDRCRNRK